MPNFTSSKTDRAYENFMKHVPGFQRDPPEAKIIQVDTEERTLKVQFDGRDVEYDHTELDELTLAYAATIHKSQGSEYPIVVMPVLMTHYVMLQRNMLYTGITRAKKLLVLIGTKQALRLAVRTVTAEGRNTRLKERLEGGAASTNA